MSTTKMNVKPYYNSLKHGFSYITAGVKYLRVRGFAKDNSKIFTIQLTGKVAGTRARGTRTRETLARVCESCDDIPAKAMSCN